MSASEITQKQSQVGLCGDCAHARRIESDRGSVFLLCELSATDPRFAKYPRLPVLSCSGYLQQRAASRNPIVVVEYDPAWPAVFEELRARVSAALGELAVVIEHAGSTAIAGLAAKPIIDVDVLLRSAADLDLAIERLAAVGYKHRGDLGVPGREAFAAPPGAPQHHLYVCPPDSTEYLRHLAFRDHLRSHAEAAKAYGELKRSLAMRFRDDREAYNAAKREFVESVLRVAEASQ